MFDLRDLAGQIHVMTQQQQLQHLPNAAFGGVPSVGVGAPEQHCAFATAHDGDIAASLPEAEDKQKINVQHEQISGPPRLRLKELGQDLHALVDNKLSHQDLMKIELQSFFQMFVERRFAYDNCSIPTEDKWLRIWNQCIMELKVHWPAPEHGPAAAQTSYAYHDGYDWDTYACANGCAHVCQCMRQCTALCVRAQVGVRVHDCAYYACSLCTLLTPRMCPQLLIGVPRILGLLLGPVRHCCQPTCGSARVRC